MDQWQDTSMTGKGIREGPLNCTLTNRWDSESQKGKVIMARRSG